MVDDTKPVEAWQHPVDDHDVVAFAGGKEKPVATVWRMIDNVPMPRRLLRDGRCHTAVLIKRVFMCSATRLERVVRR